LAIALDQIQHFHLAEMLFNAILDLVKVALAAAERATD